VPRKPVNEVIEHRITFGQKERDLIESTMTAYSFNRVTTPVVALLSDVSAMTTIVTAYLVYKYGPDALQYMKQDAYEDVTGLLDDAASAIAGLPVISQTLDIAGFVANLGSAGFGSVTGTFDESNYNFLRSLGLVGPLPGRE
tara:strand:+ start:71 stop:496 length:426 start_codon:yes stop_codon:yes gene_type:complete